jgi:phosphoglycolate phosphatase
MDLSKKLIVFDWNGTILSDTRASWLAGNECMKFYGAKAMDLSEYRDLFTFPIIDFYIANGLSAAEVLARKDESNIIFQTAYEAYAQNARTRRGAREVLQWLKAEGATCIILSNYVTDKIRHHVQRLKLGDYIDHICAHTCDGTTILEKTTKAARLKAYMDKSGHAAHDTFIIGDTMEEPEIARAFGLTSIGITDGYISTARLKAAKPDYMIGSLQDIKCLIT